MKIEIKVEERPKWVSAYDGLAWQYKLQPQLLEDETAVVQITTRNGIGDLTINAGMSEHVMAPVYHNAHLYQDCVFVLNDANAGFPPEPPIEIDLPRCPADDDDQQRAANDQDTA